jgi:hypothetical protein
MAQTTETTYFLFQQGAVQEEPRSWEEIEAMARAGFIGPETLIFMPDVNDWRRAADTPVACFFEEDAGVEAAPDPSQNEELQAQYQQLCSQVAQGEWKERIHAADLAVQLAKPEEAVKHFRQALKGNPYHPRIVQEAKRMLSTEEWTALPYFERVAPAWDDLAGIARFPLRRGPVYLLGPALVLAALSLIPGGIAIAAGLIFLWLTQIASGSGKPSSKPPKWKNIIMEPASLLRSVIMMPLLAVELYGLFFLAAAVMPRLPIHKEAGLLEVIGNSPLLVVPMFMLTLLYVPAVLTLVANPAVSITEVLNPKFVFSAIARMEREYLTTVGVVAAPVCVWVLIGFAFDAIPYVGGVLTGVLGAYVFAIVGCTLAKLRARFAEYFGGKLAV